MDVTESRLSTRRSIYISTAIALAAFAWYCVHIGAGDVLTDEGLLGFRSLGLLDFFFSVYQTTPLEWFADNPPWWVKVWFHDHPPVIFFVQHWSLALFGTTATALRIPSACAAAVSVFLVGRIAGKYGGRRAGIIAALMLAVLAGHVSMARVGLQEAFLGAWLLLSGYCALRAHRCAQPGWWYGAAIAWGIAFLTKYTAVALLPSLGYMYFRGMRHISLRHRWGILAILILCMLPVAGYNVLLFRKVGHFDFQLSYLFGQQVPQWQVRPGREYFSDLPSRIRALIPNLARHASIPMNGLAAVVGIATIYRVLRRRADVYAHMLLITIVSWVTMFIITGPLPWFTYLWWPWMILLIIHECACRQKKSYGARILTPRKYSLPQWGIWGGVLIICAIEMAVAYNTMYRTNPHGWRWVTYLPLEDAHARWGYQKLEQYISIRLHGRYPGGTFPLRYPFLEVVRDAAIMRAKTRGQEPAVWLLVYDTALYQNPLLWTFFRRTVYEGWPVLDVDTYRRTRDERGEDVFWRQGFSRVLFIRVDVASGILTRTDESWTDGGAILEAELRAANITPTASLNSPKTGKEAFRIYDLAPAPEQ